MTLGQIALALIALFALYTLYTFIWHYLNRKKSYAYQIKQMDEAARRRELYEARELSLKEKREIDDIIKRSSNE